MLRHANNLESVLTYEGTSEFHQPVIGQPFTGISAFAGVRIHPFGSLGERVSYRGPYRHHQSMCRTRTVRAMARDGGINEPTREFPGYPTGDDLRARSDVTPEPVSGPPGVARRTGRRPALVLGVAALAVVVLLGVQATGILPDFRNPFAKEQTDRSQPPLLKSIRDLSRYVAAEGNFQVVVDLQNDRRERAGVPAQRAHALRRGGQRRGVRRLHQDRRRRGGRVRRREVGRDQTPRAAARRDHLDLEKSYVFAEQRGLLNRLDDLVKTTPTGSSRSTSWPRTGSPPPPGTAG